MKIKIKIFLVLIFLMVMAYGIKYTYSLYIAGTNATADIKRARWEIKLNSADITTGSSQNISFTPVFSSNNVVNGKLAPGATGYFDIIVDSSKVDVSYSYNLSFTNNSGNGNPINVIFTSSKIYNKNNIELFEYNTETESYSLSGSLKMDNASSADKLKIIYPNTSGYTKKNNTDSNYYSNTYTIRTYYSWYETSDDTNIGHNSSINDSLSKIKINVNMSFEQLITS